MQPSIEDFLVYPFRNMSGSQMALPSFARVFKIQHHKKSVPLAGSTNSKSDRMESAFPTKFMFF